MPRSSNPSALRNVRPSGRKRKDNADYRSEARRDCDRIIYSTEWRRLAGVTQVISPLEDQAVLHNRLTHSEKVAQVARTVAESVCKRYDKALVKRLGGLDPVVCEAAGLAHDLGHPPFGHVGESTLDSIARLDEKRGGLGLPQGFEGNAQTFRIVTQGSLRSLRYEGLDLTFATLAAIAKYPWTRARQLSDDKEHRKALSADDGDPEYRRKWRKFNAYESQYDLLRRARSWSPMPDGTQTLEASTMDVADDIAYAVHDLEDFYLGGLLDIPLILHDLHAVFAPGGKPRTSTFSEIGNTGNPFSGENALRLKKDYLLFSGEEYQEAAAEVHQLLEYYFTSDPSAASSEASARSATSDLIGDLIGKVELSERPLWKNGPHLGLTGVAWHKVQIMKTITRSYIISRPDIALLQRGQQTIITGLVRLLRDWVSSIEDRKRLPKRLLTEFELAESQKQESSTEKIGYGGEQQAPRGEPLRAILDYICTLTDQQCVVLYQKLSGIQVHRLGLIGAW